MRNIIYSLISIGIFASCAKEKVGAPNFEVSTASLTYKAGDSVKFQISGNPDNLMFYSGEQGHKYELRKRDSAENDLQIEFRSYVSFGLIRQNLQLLVSNDFTGKADTPSVKAATWTDITSKAVLSTGPDSVPSGLISMKPYVNAQKPSSPIYIAFRYTDYKKPQGQNRWVIRTFGANNVAPDGTVTPMAVMATGGWQQVNFKNTALVWSIGTAQLLMNSSAATADDNEDWVISKGFDPTYIKQDVGTALKNISTTLPEFGYVFTKPGTYKVVFEGSAVRYNGEQRTTREVTLTITP
jgi:hypothetical protein